MIVVDYFLILVLISH